MKQTKNTEGLIEMPDLSTSIVCKNLYESFYASIKTSQDGKTNISLDTRSKILPIILPSLLLKISNLPTLLNHN